MKNIIKFVKNNLITKFEKSATMVFLFGISFVLLLLAQSIFLASIKYFSFIPILIACVISFIASIVFLYLIRKETRFLPKTVLPLVLILAVVSIIIIFYPHDNFGGTDNGVYINLGFYLADNGSFETPDYLNGLPPGIEVAKISEPAYRTWLATQKILFGTSTAVRGNFLLIVLGMTALFWVCSLLKDKKMGLLSTTLFATSMPLLWFSRETMTENMAFFLLWTAFFFFIVFLKSRQFVFLVYLILTILLLCLTRPEGIFISFFTLLALLIFAVYKKMLSRKLLLMIIIGIVLIFFVSISSYQAAYTNVMLGVNRSISADLYYFFFGKPFLLQRYPLFFANMLIKYNFFLVIILIFVLLIQLMFSTKNRRENNFYFFAMVIIIIPEFYKLINPNVGMLQPWFYRRYLYALIPLGYLSLSFFLSNLKNKKISIMIFSLFVIANLVLSYPIMFLKNNWGLYDAMSKIANIISPNDLVIIKNDRILGYYYPQYYLIMQKSVRAIYTFDVSDKDLSLEQKTYKGFPFNKLYYLSDISDDYYKNYLFAGKQIIDVSYSQLQPSCELQFMASEFGIQDFSLISYPDALSYCRYPRNDIIQFKKHLYIYQIPTN